jgi:hypothetical protein
MNAPLVRKTGCFQKLSRATWPVEPGNAAARAHAGQPVMFNECAMRKSIVAAAATVATLAAIAPASAQRWNDTR